MESIVYFSKIITPKSVKKLFETLNVKLKGKTLVKVHSGEKGNQNFLGPEFWEEVFKCVDGVVCECNTAYEGERNSSEKHKKLLHEHGWDKYFPVDILDEENDDLVLEIPNGKVIKKDYIGKNTNKYNSLLVLSHFKGHPMGGYGGALKQLSIGMASSRGKAYIHSGGKTRDCSILWDNICSQDDFLTSMADSASAVHNYFKGQTVYINVMKNMSIDCDCCSIAEDPCLKDIGVLISTDPIAIDKACLDLVYQAKDDPGQAHFLERVTSRNGALTIIAAKKLGFGSDKYRLINIDND